MRRLHAGVAISAAVHVAMVAWVSAYAPPTEPWVRQVAAPAVALAAAPPPEVIEVAMLPQEPMATARPAAAAPTVTRGRATRATDPAAIAARGTGTTPDETPAAPAEPGRSLFDMRRGRIDLGLGRKPDWADALDHHAPPGTGPEPEVVPSGKLEPDGGGTMRSDQGPFTAKIARGGEVTLKDKANLQYKFPLRHPGRLVTGLGRMLGDWYQDPNKPVGLIGRADPGPPESRINLDEAVEGEPDLAEASGKAKPDHGKAPIKIVGGSFDATDALMRSKGIDPYAAKKLAFLDATRAERVQMGQRHRKTQLAQVAIIMQGNLDRLWASVREPQQRKLALFELWDECVELGSDDVVTAGREARALVIGFIRARLPRGASHAYTPEELAALNARKQSRSQFAPYGAPADSSE